MTRCHADPVEVVRGDEKPARFVWRSRLYVVRGVLAHWVEADQWWHQPEATRTVAGRAGPGDWGADWEAEPRGGGFGTGPSDTVAGSAWSAGDVFHADPTGELGAEREVWRVEASAGRCAGSGVYDLCLTWPSGVWTLMRTAD
jgi:hypothetical protein